MYNLSATGNNIIICTYCKEQMTCNEVEVEEKILNNIESILIKEQYVYEWDCPKCDMVNRL